MLAVWYGCVCRQPTSRFPSSVSSSSSAFASPGRRWQGGRGGDTDADGDSDGDGNGDSAGYATGELCSINRYIISIRESCNTHVSGDVHHLREGERGDTVSARLV